MSDNHDRSAELPTWLRERMHDEVDECVERPNTNDFEVFVLGAEACYRALLEAGPEFDWKAAQDAAGATSSEFIYPTGRTYQARPDSGSFVAGARWQYEQNRLALAAMKAECVRLKAELEKPVAHDEDVFAAWKVSYIGENHEVNFLKAEVEAWKARYIEARASGAKEGRQELEAEVARLRNALEKIANDYGAAAGSLRDIAREALGGAGRREMKFDMGDVLELPAGLGWLVVLSVDYQTQRVTSRWFADYEEAAWWRDMGLIVGGKSKI